MKIQFFDVDRFEMPADIPDGWMPFAVSDHPDVRKVRIWAYEIEHFSEVW